MQQGEQARTGHFQCPKRFLNSPAVYPLPSSVSVMVTPRLTLPPSATASASAAVSLSSDSLPSSVLTSLRNRRISLPDPFEHSTAAALDPLKHICGLSPR